MSEVFMQKAQPSSTKYTTEIMVNIIDIIYDKSDFEQFAVYATQLHYEKKKPIGIINKLEELFDGNIIKQDTDHVNLELKPDSKNLNHRYYLVPRINKPTLHKDIEHLV